MKSIKQYDVLDLTKIILAFMIVAIHCDLFPSILYPWLRVATPLFFMISSFLLFDKINHSFEEEWRGILKKYIGRLLKYYFFWFIVLLPFTISFRKAWFSSGFFIGFFKMIYSFFFSSTFPVSWFLAALIEGIILVFFFRKYKKEKLLFVFSIFSYVFCCLVSSYPFLFPKSILSVLEWLDLPFSFLLSLVFLMFGKMFADGCFQKVSRKKFLIFSFFFAFLLFSEWKVVFNITGEFRNDFYFFLFPFVVSLFGFIHSLPFKIPYAKILREFSSFLYPSHYFPVYFIFMYLRQFFSSKGLVSVLSMIFSIFFCGIVFFLVKIFEKTNYLKFFRVSY